MIWSSQFNMLLNEWWIRIVLFCSICFLLFYAFMNFENTFILSNFNLIIALVLQGISTFIEFFRINSKWYYFGFFNVFKKDQLKNHLILLLTGITNTIILAVICLSFSNVTTFSQPNFFSLIALIYNFILIAFIEESFFRGIIFQAIEDKFGSTFSIFLTSLAFSSAHFFNPNFSVVASLNTFMAGILFSVIFLLTRSIIFSSLFHFYWNLFLALFIGAPLSGMNEKISIIAFSHYSIPDILTGGLYGFEGGIIVTWILLLNILFLSKRLYLSPIISSKLLIRDYSSFVNTHKRTISSSQLNN